VATTALDERVFTGACGALLGFPLTDRLLKSTIAGVVSFLFIIFVSEFFNPSAEAVLASSPATVHKTIKFFFIENISPYL
jgi:hypothetical protein